MILQRILVPVDFSPCSFVAVDAATTLARSFAADVDVLHVWELSSYFPPEAILLPTVVPASLEVFARTRAGRWMKEFLGQLETDGVRARGRLESGTPWRTIVRVAQDDGYDAIVMATHGHTNLAHIMLGSVTERVVRHATCPVITIRGAGRAVGAGVEGVETTVSAGN